MAEFDWLGTPGPHPVANLQVHSPRISELLAELRGLGNPLPHLAPFLVAGLFVGALAWMCGATSAGTAIAVIVGMAAAACLFVTRIQAVPGALAQHLEAFAEQPTSENAEKLARSYKRLGSNGGVVAHYTHAVLWGAKALALRSGPDDPSLVFFIGLAAGDLSSSMRHRHYFSSDSILLADTVAIDFLTVAEKLERSPDKRESIHDIRLRIEQMRARLRLDG